MSEPTVCWVVFGPLPVMSFHFEPSSVLYCHLAMEESSAKAQTRPTSPLAAMAVRPAVVATEAACWYSWPRAHGSRGEMGDHSRVTRPSAGNAERRAGVPVSAIGATGGAALTVEGASAISIAALRRIHEAWLPAYMAGEAEPSAAETTRDSV